MDKVKTYSKEWFVEQGAKKQKSVIKALKQTDKLNDSEKEIKIKKYLITGSVSTVKSLLQNTADTAPCADQRSLIRKIGVDKVVSILDIDGNGKITDEEFLEVAFSDENEFSDKKNSVFTAKDLEIIFENAVKSQKGIVKKSNNVDKYAFKDGSTTTISKNTDGEFIFKTEEEIINENEKHSVNYDYSTSIKYESIEDSKGRIRFASIDAPGKLNDKTVTTEYEESGVKNVKTDTIGKTEKISFSGTGEQISKDISVKYDSNGEIEDTKQKDIGDCWLLSGVNALRVTTEGRKLIKNSIKQNDDGSVTVTLKGVNRSYTYSAEEIVLSEYTAKNKNFSSGDVDMNLIEKAVGDYRCEMAKKSEKGFTDVPIDDPLNAGFNNEAFIYLTGEKVSSSYTLHFQLKDLDKKEKDPDRYAMTASFINCDNSFNEDIKNKHTYSITRVTKDEVYVVDPWNSSKEIHYPMSKFRENLKIVSLLDVSKINN